ncbi:MAG: hypothetical protein ACO3N7_02650 [Kiritimatiellia bacterium]
MKYLRELAGAGLGYTLLSFLVFAHHVPLSEFHRSLVQGDALDAAYFLAWGHHVLSSGFPEKLFDLPISYPLPHAGGLTDLVPGLVWITWPLSWVLSNPVTVFHTTMMLCGIGNALSFYVLTRTLGCRPPAAFLSGLSFAFSGFMMSHYYGHITMFALFPTPLALALFGYAMRRGSLAAYAGISGLVFLQGTLSSRLGILCVFTLLVLWVAQGRAPWRRQRWKPLLLPMGLAIAVAGVSRVYADAFALRELIPSSRNLMSSVFLSADLQGYIFPFPPTLTGLLARNLLGVPSFLENIQVAERHNYWGGWVILGALVSVGIAVRQKKARSELFPWMVLALVGFLFSLGPFLWAGGTLFRVRLPWFFVLETIPSLQTFRAVARFSLLAGLGLNVLFAFSLSTIKAEKRMLWGVIFLLLLADTVPLRERSRTEVPQESGISRFLESLDEDASVIHLPYLQKPSPFGYHFGNFVPLANSTPVGTRNPYFLHLIKLTTEHPLSDLTGFLREMGITHVIVHNEVWRERLDADLNYEKVTPFGFRILESHFRKEALTSEEILEIRREFDPLKIETHYPQERFQIDFLPGEEPGRMNVSGMVPVDPSAPGRYSARDLNPYLVLNLPEPVPSEQIARVVIRFRTPDAIRQRTDTIFYWATPDHWYRPGHEIRALHAVHRDWQVLSFDPADAKKWAPGDLITSFRFDLFSPSLPGERIEIDRVGVLLHSDSGE